MTILVTGGAGFIGSNFVLDWLAQSDEPVVNLDALTYAGNLQNLAALQGHARHVFVHGDICDRPLLDRVLAEHRPRALLHFAAEAKQLLERAYIHVARRRPRPEAVATLEMPMYRPLVALGMMSVISAQSTTRNAPAENWPGIFGSCATTRPHGPYSSRWATSVLKCTPSSA